MQTRNETFTPRHFSVARLEKFRGRPFPISRIKLYVTDKLPYSPRILNHSAFLRERPFFKHPKILRFFQTLSIPIPIYLLEMNKKNKITLNHVRQINPYYRLQRGKCRHFKIILIFHTLSRHPVPDTLRTFFDKISRQKPKKAIPINFFFDLNQLLYFRKNWQDKPRDTMWAQISCGVGWNFSPFVSLWWWTSPRGDRTNSIYVYNIILKK